MNAQDGCTQNWPEVEEQLKMLEAAYSEIGSAGAYVREFVLRPLRDRFNAEERSNALAEEIMAVSL
jgi:hypothetical protein